MYVYRPYHIKAVNRWMVGSLGDPILKALAVLIRAPVMLLWAPFGVIKELQHISGAVRQAMAL